MHSSSLLITLLILTLPSIEAQLLPLQSSFASCLRNSLCRHNLFTTGGIEDPPLTLIRLTSTFDPIIGSTRPLPTTFDFSITTERSTTPYSNTGDPTSAFSRARRTAAPAVGEGGVDVGNLDAVLVKKSGTFIGNGIEADGDTDERSVANEKPNRTSKPRHRVTGDNDTAGGASNTLTHTSRARRGLFGGGSGVPLGFANEMGTFGGGGGVPPLIARDPGNLECGSKTPPLTVRDMGSAEGDGGVPPGFANQRGAVGGGGGVPPLVPRNLGTFGGGEIARGFKNEMGVYGGGGGTPPLIARDPGGIGGSNGTPPLAAGDRGSTDGTEWNN